MKTIIIKDYQKYMGSVIPKELNSFIEPAFKNGYWNVFLYTDEFQQFLVNKEIEHKINVY